MRMTIRRIAATSAVIAAGAIPLFVAAPAQASAADCRAYIAAQNYPTGSVTEHACALGAKSDGVGGAVYWQLCYNEFKEHKVKPADATEACDEATW